MSKYKRLTLALTAAALVAAMLPGVASAAGPASWNIYPRGDCGVFNTTSASDIGGFVTSLQQNEICGFSRVEPVFP